MKRRNSKKEQEFARFKIVSLYQKKKRNSEKRKYTFREISEIMEVSETAVYKIIDKYKEGGKKALYSKKRGVKEGKKLIHKIEKQVVELITDKTPEQLEFPFALWTISVVQQLLSTRFGIELSQSQVGRYLKKWGLTPQKPIYKSYEQCPEEVKKWLDKTYPKIKKEAKKDGATIFWGDETGIKNTDNRGRSYSPKGKTPEIKASGKRFGINMISAISNNGHLQFMLYEQSMSSQLFVKFMKKLIRNNDRKVCLIVDNLRVHHSTYVSNFVNRYSDRISLHHLPKYSPELNPDEYVNQDLKVSISNKRKSRTKDELKDKVIDHMNARKNDSEQVKKYFNAKAVGYAS